MLHIVKTTDASPYGTRFENNMSRGVVVLESDLVPKKGGNYNEAFAELSSTDARDRALGFAASQGVGDPRINGNPTSPYPVNKDGVPLEYVRDSQNQPLPLTDPKMHVAKYRIDVPVTRRIV